MVGYDLISNSGFNVMNILLVLLNFGLAGTLISLYYYGMGGGAHSDWDHVPIRKWVKKNGAWEQVLTYGKYADYQLDVRYDYRWMSEVKEMGFIEDDPPPECYIICSPGMQEAVDEIIKNTPKGTYN